MRDSQYPIRVRTARYYAVRFVVDLGQRNAVFIKRPVHWGVHRHVPGTGGFAYLPEPGYDLVHSLNAVPVLTSRPFIVSFESFLPSFPDDEYLGRRREQPIRKLEAIARRRLVGDQCIRLIAWSEYAVRQFSHQNRDAPEKPLMQRKMEVLYPAIDIRADRPKAMPNVLRVLHVGRNFMGKGGPALVRAHSRLKAMGIPIETTVVSSLDWSATDYIGPSSEEYVRRELMRITEDGITLHRGLPNHEVLALMKAATFFVFPTMHDTFGFAPLEALAAGTPVIATATGAQPEIVSHGESGFLIPFENDDNVGRWPWIYRRQDPDYLDAYDAAIERSAAGIADTLAGAWENRSDYERMSAAALERARSRFNKERARDRLEMLYELAR